MKYVRSVLKNVRSVNSRDQKYKKRKVSSGRKGLFRPHQFDRGIAEQFTEQAGEISRMIKSYGK